MNRREFLGTVAGAMLAAAVGPEWLGCRALGATPARRPNIIHILADDLGYGDLGAYGQRHFATPRLDQMAAEGLRFTQHYAGSTVCAPSRACLLTGLHTGHVHMRGNGPYSLRPDPDDTTVARLLKCAGYSTGLIGKSGLASNDDDGTLPNRKGFDYFFGFTSHSAAHRHYPQWLWRNGEKVEYPQNKGMEGEHYANELFAQEAETFIERQKGTPFFLHLALTLPHADLTVPEAYRAPYVGRFEETPAEAGNYRAQDMPKATYAGMVSFVDAVVGRVLDKLRELDLDRHTLVIFTSDNGSHLEGGYHYSHLNSNGPLRGGKRDLYEGGIRVPHLAWWPGTVKPGVTDHLSAFWDFLPTVCELSGAPIPEGIDGISYAPTLMSSGRGQKQHDYLYWEFYGRRGSQAVRRGRWKAIRMPVDKDLNGPIQLFDLQTDLKEEKDLASVHPEIVREMDQLMRAAHRPNELFQFPDPRKSG